MRPAPLKPSLCRRLLDCADFSRAIFGFGLPFNEVIGQPREMRVCDLPLPLAATMKGGAIAVRIRP